MNRSSFMAGFADELVKTSGALGDIPDVLRKSLLARAAAWGAVAGLGSYFGRRALAAAGAAEDPRYLGESALTDAVRGAGGAAAVAGGLKLLGKA